MARKAYRATSRFYSFVVSQRIMSESDPEREELRKLAKDARSECFRAREELPDYLRNRHQSLGEPKARIEARWAGHLLRSDANLANIFGCQSAGSDSK
jgi:hypothetical protein